LFSRAFRFSFKRSDVIQKANQVVLYGFFVTRRFRFFFERLPPFLERGMRRKKVSIPAYGLKKRIDHNLEFGVFGFFFRELLHDSIIQILTNQFFMV